MSDPEVKLAYSAALLRIRAELTPAICRQSEAPPEDLIKRARTKMDAEKNEGKIAFFVVYGTRLNETWQRLREWEGDDSEVITITLAAGAPEFPGVRVEPADGDKIVCYLSIETPRHYTVKWLFQWFLTYVRKRLRDEGVKTLPNSSQIHGAFLRAQRGEKITRLAISAMPEADANARPISVVANKARQELAFVIRDVDTLIKQGGGHGLQQLANKAIAQMARSGIELSMQPELGMQADALISSSERLGLDLPVVLLGACSLPKKVAKKRKQVPANYPGAGKLEIDVSDDRLEAYVADFDLNLYDDQSFEVSMEWVEKEAKRVGVSVDIDDDVRLSLSDAIKKQSDLTGMMIARGIPAIGGRAPYLYPSYQDAETRADTDLDSDQIDLRHLQQRKIVSADQLVAEIRFEEAPQKGKNVYGEDLEASGDDDELIVRVGEGIQQRESGKFYATCDGIPILEEESISLSKILVHQGDVNLRTGNIVFDGPVEIRGSIDTGSVVECTGDLIVHGTLRGGFVRCGGTLTAKAGMVTGETGRVVARNDITADFIENSSVTCGGDLTVGKAILNSTVICGGNIKILKPTGVIAGGHISCRENIKTGGLGFQNGALTHLEVGVDWRTQQAVMIRTTRLETLKNQLIQDRQAMRELVQKSKAQLTPKHAEMKEKFQKRVSRLREIVDRATEHLERSRRLLTYQTDVKVLVRELLASNINVSVGGQKITVANDVAGVAILPKRRRGSYIVPIHEVAGDEDKQKEAS